MGARIRNPASIAAVAMPAGRGPPRRSQRTITEYTATPVSKKEVTTS